MACGIKLRRIALLPGAAGRHNASVSPSIPYRNRHKRMKDLIIGCFTNYGWSTVQYWANSVDTCGFNGDRALVFYNADAHTIDRLESLRFDTYGFDPATIIEGFAYPFPFEVMAHRLYVYFDYLTKLPNMAQDGQSRSD